VVDWTQHAIAKRPWTIDLCANLPLIERYCKFLDYEPWKLTMWAITWGLLLRWIHGSASSNSRLFEARR